MRTRTIAVSAWMRGGSAATVIVLSPDEEDDGGFVAGVTTIAPAPVCIARSRVVSLVPEESQPTLKQCNAAGT